MRDAGKDESWEAGYSENSSESANVCQLRGYAYAIVILFLAAVKVSFDKIRPFSEDPDR